MTAYNSLWQLLTASQSEQLTRTSQCLFFRRGSEGVLNKIKFKVGFKDTKCDISYGSKVGIWSNFLVLSELLLKGLLGLYATVQFFCIIWTLLWICSSSGCSTYQGTWKYSIAIMYKNIYLALWCTPDNLRRSNNKFQRKQNQWHRWILSSYQDRVWLQVWMEFLYLPTSTSTGWQ